MSIAHGKEDVMEKENKYIAYGSNLNREQMERRCPTAKVLGRSIINDYRLLFRKLKTGSYVTIEPCEGKCVPVLLWSVCSEDKQSLDRYEGYPRFYEKEEMNILLNGETTSAFVYIMTPGHELGMPSDVYLNIIEEGYKEAGFDLCVLDDAIADTQARISLEHNNNSKQAEMFWMRWW
jgi:gamma-glutamylcyclotransferase (GGCT)/AIG2-like uncharacterized protein YtfP